MHRLLLALFVLAAVLAGCLPSHPAVAPAAGAPPLRPDAFFLGATHGEGTLHVLTRGSTPITVDSQGEPLADGSFRLVQQIQEGDAAPRERTWIMIPDGPDTWTGSLTDASGPVSVEAEGSVVRIRYRMNAVTTFHQRLVLLPDGRTVENRSSARVLGVPIARLTEVITQARTSDRVEGSEQVGVAPRGGR